MRTGLPVVVVVLAAGLAVVATPAATSAGDLDNAGRCSRDGFKALDAGDLGRAKKSFEQAVEAFESCIVKNPELSAACNNLALAYWRVGRLDDARRRLAKAEQLGIPVNARFKEVLERAQPQA